METNFSQPTDAEIIAVLQDIDPFLGSLLTAEEPSLGHTPEDAANFSLTQLDLIDDSDEMLAAKQTDGLIKLKEIGLPAYLFLGKILRREQIDSLFAYLILDQCREEALPLLMEALATGSYQEKIEAAHALSPLNDDRSYALFLFVANTSDDPALVAICKTALSGLFDKILLSMDRWQDPIGEKSMQAVTRFKDAGPIGFDYLGECCSKTGHIAMNAQRAIQLIGKDAEYFYLKALQTDDLKSQRNAAHGLKWLMSLSLFPTFTDLTAYHPDKAIRNAFVMGIARFQHPEAVDTLEAFIEREEDQILKYKAIIQLGETQDPRAYEVILKWLKDSDASVELRVAAIRSIVALKDKRATEPLLAFLDHPKWRLRKTATEYLGYLGDERAYPHILKMQNDKHKRVRKAAQEAISSFYLKRKQS